MNLFLIILIAILVAAGLAYAIVKFIPLNLRWIVSILLLITSGFLVYKIYGGIMNPIKFRAEKEKRYTKVIEKLKLIRDAQEKYKKAYGLFSKDEKALTNFVKYDSLAITDTRNIEKTITKAGNITVKTSVKQVDTVGYEPVIKYFKGKNLDKLFSVKVPGIKEPIAITVETGTVEKVEDVFVPVFKAKVEKIKVLHKMNDNEINQEIKAIKTSEVKGEFISVGSLEEVTLGGNWPPTYDQKENMEKNDKK